MKKAYLISIVLSVFGTCFILSGCGNNSWDNESDDRDFLLTSDPAASRSVSRSGYNQDATGDCGEYALVRSYPQEKVIRLERNMPQEAQLNTQFKYSIKVTNITNVLLTDIIIKENVSEYFRLDRTNPASGKDGNNILWIVPSLAPKDSINLEVFGSATRTGCISNCSTLSYNVPTCTSVEIVEAKLALKKTMPTEVLICDSIPVQYVVTNSGTGNAKNVRIVDALPDGLQTADGKNQIVINAGNLEQGESLQFESQLKATKTGRFTNKAVATTEGGLQAEATANTIVRQPVLGITKQGREVHFLGRPLSYEITVTNRGDGIAKNAIIEENVPRGVTDVQASAGAKLSGSKVVWVIGDLAPGSSKTVSLSYTPTAIGTLNNTASVSAYCAETKTATVTTSIRGIPAILLEVVDLQDPVEVGGTTTYVITATNQGSIAGTNIAITGSWENEQQYVSSSGATNGSVSGNTIRFAPLKSLAPQAKATWQIVMKAASPGSILFKVAMQSSEFDRPVEETESTNLY